MKEISGSALTYLLSSVKTLALHVLVLLIFGFAFLFSAHSQCGGGDICGRLGMNSLGFTVIDMSNQTNIVRSFVFSYIVGLLLHITGIYSFRTFRRFNFDLWKSNGQDASQNRQQTALDRINDTEINEYLEEHPHVADVYTLEQIHSTITRPLFSLFLFAAILFSEKLDVATVLVWIAILLLIVVGLSADTSANAFAALIKQRIKDRGGSVSSPSALRNTR